MRVVVAEAILVLPFADIALFRPFVLKRVDHSQDDARKKLRKIRSLCRLLGEVFNLLVSSARPEAAHNVRRYRQEDSSHPAHRVSRLRKDHFASVRETAIVTVDLAQRFNIRCIPYRYILTANHGYKIAVCMNDFGDSTDIECKPWSVAAIQVLAHLSSEVFQPRQCPSRPNRRRRRKALSSPCRTDAFAVPSWSRGSQLLKTWSHSVRKENSQLTGLSSSLPEWRILVSY